MAPIGWAALAGWIVLLAGVRVWGVWLSARRELKLDAVPLYGRWDWALSWRVAVPVMAGAVLVAALPWLSRRWAWRLVVLGSGAAAIAWSLALAVVDTGPAGSAVWSDIQQAYGTHTGLVDAAGPGAFLRDYVDNQPGYAVHLQAHPPGLVLGLWAAGRIGLAGPGFQTALALVGVAIAVVAAVVVVREVAGERWARAAAPFVVLVPAAVWHTNADVIVAGVGLSGVACAVVATGRHGRQAVAWAIAGGVLLGAALLLSYGVALLAAPVLVVAVWRQRWTVLAGGAAVVLAVVLVPLAWGFWWFDGLLVTGQQYAAGVASERGYAYFVVANLAVFALAVGPATVVALARLRDRRMWIVVGAGLATMLLADLSGLSNGETERIWQPFVPLVAVAGGALGVRSPAAGRVWLAVQVSVAVVLQAALRSPW